MTARTSSTRTHGRCVGLIVAGLVAVLMVAGCEADPQAVPEPTAAPTAGAQHSVSAAPSASATPTPKPASSDGPAENLPVPKKPALADEKSKAGMHAFAKYWFELLSYAYKSGDLVPIRAVTSNECSQCKRVNVVISDWHSEGRWMEGGQIRIEEIDDRFVETTHKSYNPVVLISQSKIGFYLRNGKLNETLRAEKSGYILELVHNDDNWVLQKLLKPGHL